MSVRTKSASREPQDFQVIDEFVKKSNGESYIRSYNKGRFLGKGGFARVYEFINTETKQVFAGKIIEKSSLTKARLRQKLMSEIKIHRSLDHENIVKFEHFFEDSENVYILLEVCANQTLSELLKRRKRLTEIETQCYLVQLISALKYIHSHKVIHRDIKLGNLFLSEKLEIKLGDFGLASKLEFEGERKRTICGTPNYIAPEILDGSNGHSFEVDVWSLGVLAYTLLIGKPPFETNDLKTTYRRIKMNAYAFPEHVFLSNEAKDMIKDVLITEPHLRPTLQDILQMPFFNKNLIPKAMPLSSLAIPPSAVYLKHFNACDENKPPNTARVSVKSIERSMGNDPEQAENIDPMPAIVSAKTKNCNKSTKNLETENKGNEDGLVLIPPTIKVLKVKDPKKVAIYSHYQPINQGPEVWVKKWVDYSSKYGIGYLLSNSCVGVYFNDSSKIISDSAGLSFLYQAKSSAEEILFAVDSPPSDLKKKVALLEQFRRHLLSGTYENLGIKPTVFIKKYVQTPHAVFFRMNNKVVQVKFMDKSELLLCSHSKNIVYINKSMQSSVHPISTALETGSLDLTKRLRYTKEILSAGVSTQCI